MGVVILIFFLYSLDPWGLLVLLLFLRKAVYFSFCIPLLGCTVLPARVCWQVLPSHVH